MASQLDIPVREVRRRLGADNPWWRAGAGIDPEEAAWPRRAYFPHFCRLALEVGGAPCGSADRATPCRQDGDAEAPGKTLVGRRCLAGTAILYASLDTPLYSGRSLEIMVRLFMDAHDHGSDRQLWILFDEVQYHKGWEVHLKSLVDSYPRIRFIASGSAAAALRMKSRESGAGRFTEFLLPPLTFAEYLNFAGREEELIVQRQFPWIPARRSRASRSRSSGPMPLSDRARSYVV